MSENQIIDTPENWSAASPGYAEKVAPRSLTFYFFLSAVAGLEKVNGKQI